MGIIFPIHSFICVYAIKFNVNAQEKWIGIKKKCLMDVMRLRFSFGWLNMDGWMGIKYYFLYFFGLGILIIIFTFNMIARYRQDILSKETKFKRQRIVSTCPDTLKVLIRGSLQVNLFKIGGVVCLWRPSKSE